MNTVLLMNAYDIVYLAELINLTNEHDIVAIINTSLYFDNSKYIPNISESIVPIVNSFDDIHQSFDTIIKFVDELDLPSNIIDQLMKMQKNGVKVIDLSFNSISPEKELNLKCLDIPIITISKMNAKIKSTRFISQLNERIKADGYVTSVVSGDNLLYIFGSSIFPKELYGNFSIQERIETVNHYISDVINKNKTQVLIVDIPGNINDELLYIIQKAVGGDYNIVLTEAFRVFSNIYSQIERGINELFVGRVNDIIVSEFVIDFLDEDTDKGVPISQKSLKKLCGQHLTTYDVETIYNKITNYFNNPTVI